MCFKYVNVEQSPQCSSDLFQALYSESVDVWTKTELLILVEEYGCPSTISADGYSLLS